MTEITAAIHMDFDTALRFVVLATFIALSWLCAGMWVGVWISRTSGEIQARATHAWYARKLKDERDRHDEKSSD